VICIVGFASSSNTVSGVTLGMVGTLLTWMQEHSSPILTVATCNDYRKLPPELTRAGRIDERFFVDLPSLIEREEIARVHLERLKITTDLAPEIAALTDTWTGAEIEQLVKSAARRTQRKITSEAIKQAAATIKPIAKVDPEGTEQLRRWGKECLTIANSPDQPAEKGRRVKR
jgi:SpoVK/Ycf46/Vps4 family AAA+-type ATPase